MMRKRKMNYVITIPYCVELMLIAYVSVLNNVDVRSGLVTDRRRLDCCNCVFV